jgi:O-antigen/teichoic acid export membrane protein
MPKSFNVEGQLLARNALLNLLGQGLPLIVALFAIPPTVHALGVERFGVLGLLWVILNYFSVFDLGLGRATTRFAAEALGNRRYERIPLILWNAVFSQVLLGLSGSLALLGLTPFLVHHVLNVSAGLQDEASMAFYVLAFILPLVLMSNSFGGLLEAAQRFDLLNAVRSPFVAANYLIPLLGGLVGLGLPGIAALLLLSRLLALTILYRVCARLFPYARAVSGVSRAELRLLLGFGGWISVSGIVGPVLLYFDRFVIGALLPMSAVAYYTVPYEMVTRLSIIPGSLVATLFPTFSRLSTVKEDGALVTLAHLTARSVRYILASVGIVTVLIGIYASDLLRLWIGESVARESALVLQILAVGVLINSLAQVAYTLVQAHGRPDLTAKLHLLELPIHLLLVWELVRLWGVAGAALAWVLRVAADALMLFVLAHRLSLISSLGLWREKVPQGAGGLIVFAAIASLLATRGDTPWERGAVLITLLLMALGVVWRGFLSEGERRRIVAWLRRETP